MVVVVFPIVEDVVTDPWSFVPDTSQTVSCVLPHRSLDSCPVNPPFPFNDRSLRLDGKADGREVSEFEERRSVLRFGRLVEREVGKILRELEERSLREKNKGG